LRPGLETPGFVVLGDPEAPAVALGTCSSSCSFSGDMATTRYPQF